MADFCNICISHLVNGDYESKNIGDIIMRIKSLHNGDMSIDKMFDNYIKNDIEEFLSDENYCLNIGGVCEHCGLVRLSVKKENDVLYLVATCLKSTKKNGYEKYKIAIINEENELEYQPEEVVKYFQEN